MQIVNHSFRLILTGVIVIAAGDAMAQSSARNIISKPFSNYQPRPVVSPYMNLFRDSDTGSSDFDYYTLVRPQLRQNQFNLRQRQQTNLLQRQVSRQQRTSQAQQQSIQRIAQQTRSPIPQAVLRPTGLGLRRPIGSRFMNLYNYYPAPRIVPRR